MLQAEIAIVVDTPIQQIMENPYSSVNFVYYKILLQTCFSYGVRAAVFNLSDERTKTVDGELYGMGLFWSTEGYLMQESRIPTILENDYQVMRPLPVLKKMYPSLAQWLDRCLILNGCTRCVDKVLLPQLLLAGGLGEYIIPTYRINSFQDILQGIQQFKTCIVKPTKGNKGIGVSYVEEKNGELIYSNSQSAGILTEESWNELRGREVFQSYILQPRLDFHNSQGFALDFRLLVSRGKNAEWETAIIHARVGGSRFVANGSSGGAITFAEEVLLREFGEDAERMMQELIMLSNAVPRALDQFNDCHVSCFGIDAAFDRQTKLPYIIEVNLAPGIDYTPWHLAEKRVRYYRHLLNRPVAEKGDYQPIQSSLIYSSKHAVNSKVQ